MNGAPLRGLCVLAIAETRNDSALPGRAREALRRCALCVLNTFAPSSESMSGRESADARSTPLRQSDWRARVDTAPGSRDPHSLPRRPGIIP